MELDEWITITSFSSKAFASGLLGLAGLPVVPFYDGMYIST